MRPILASLVAVTLLAARSGFEPAFDGPASRLPTINPFDAERAEVGRRLLFEDWPGEALLPQAALDNLYLVWGTDALLGDDFWDEFERRYGFFRADGSELPLGFHSIDGGISLSCLACHADQGPDGEAWVGVANRRLDFRRLVEDGQALADLVGVDAPSLLAADLQQSPGAIDAVGLGFILNAENPDEVPNFGYQQAPSWSGQRVKTRQFTDGSSRVSNWRITMATLTVFGWTEERLADYEDEFQDLQQYLFSIEPPAWSFEMPTAAAVARGEALFDGTCARCHGTYHGDVAGYPDKVVPLAEIGTDPLRSEAMGEEAVATLNASWFGELTPFEDTDGYLAPPLNGVWASAPYFHGGSVPDLAAVLESSTRPARWQLAEPAAYDPERVGWAWEEAAAGAPRAYDTALPGLGNGGHAFGDALTSAERADLIDYLKTL